MALSACGDDSGEATGTRWLTTSEDSPPTLLSGVGLYTEMATREVYDDLITYEPNHPLYSNGLAKERHLYVPEGVSIDGVGSRDWEFPEGTLIAKTFVYEGAPVETRLIFLTDDGWDYALYQWSDDAMDATRLEGNWGEVPLVLGGGERSHTLPGRLDCRTCHETHEAVAGAPVLGIDPWQASEALAASGVFSSSPTRLTAEGRTAAETAAFSYFIGNCTSCHNGGDSINSSFSLYPGDAVASTVDQPTESETGAGIRVVPGVPEESVLFVTVVEAPKPSYRGPFKDMPPIGVDETDPLAEPILREWIEEL
ncbi:MAG: hypothetical protein WBG86_07370 [Polyangiales bacterium]